MTQSEKKSRFSEAQREIASRGLLHADLERDLATFHQ